MGNNILKFMIEKKEVILTWQEQQLIETVIRPIAEDDENSNYTRTVAINIINKLEKKDD